MNCAQQITAEETEEKKRRGYLNGGTDGRADQVDRASGMAAGRDFVIEPLSSLSLPSLSSQCTSRPDPPSDFWFKTIAVAQQRGSERLPPSLPPSRVKAPSTPLPRSVKRRKAPCFTPPPSQEGNSEEEEEEGERSLHASNLEARSLARSPGRLLSARRRGGSFE